MQQRPTFIDDQRLCQLCLNADDGNQKLKFLRLEKLPRHGLGKSSNHDDDQHHNRWIEIPDRKSFLSSFDAKTRLLQCFTASAGIGKSVALRQLLLMRDQNLHGHLSIWIHFNSLPQSWERYLDKPVDPDDPDSLPMLVELIKDGFDALPVGEHDCLPCDPDQIRAWLESVMRMGMLTLGIDGLDEVVEESAKRKAAQLRVLLNRYPRLNCAVAGRPYAITETLWPKLFSTAKDKSHDGTSPWDFYLADMFDDDQRLRLLGRERYDQLALLKGEIEFSARTLEVLRTLDAETFSSLRSNADVYWHSIDKSVRLDRKKDGEAPQTWLKPNQILDIFSAIAITTLMWKHDPLVPNEAQIDSAAVSPTVEVDRTGIDRLMNLVRQRLCSIYPDWELKSNELEYETVAHQNIAELMRLNSSYIEFGMLDSEDADTIRWRNATQRDFFAALWMVRSSSESERAWLEHRQSVVWKFWNSENSRVPQLLDFWRFVCGMPDVAMLERDQAGKEARWLESINFLFQRHQHSRPTELMYRCWPNLMRRSGYLNSGNWSERELHQATQAAFEDISNEYPQGEQEPSQLTARKVLTGFFAEFIELRDSDGAEAKIIQADLETQWRNCDSQSGMYFLCGSNEESDNPIRPVQLTDAFELCSLLVTNQLYLLFDPFHLDRHPDYAKSNPYRRGAVTGLNWYDSMMFCIWAGGNRLATEWELEYASRGGHYISSEITLDENLSPVEIATFPSGIPPAYPWGEVFEDFEAHAWLYQNSDWGDPTIGSQDLVSGEQNPTGRHVHRVGAKKPNGFGLYDVVGNAWAWTTSRYSANALSRSLRGDSFVSTARDARCSYRVHLDPSDSGDFMGCRVARARKS